MVNNDDLGNKSVTLFRRIFYRVSSNKSSLDLIGLDFNIKSDIVTRFGVLDFLVMHLDWLNLGFDVAWSNGNVHFLFEDSWLNSSNSNCSETLNFIDIVNWNS